MCRAHRAKSALDRALALCRSAKYLRRVAEIARTHVRGWSFSAGSSDATRGLDVALDWEAVTDGEEMTKTDREISEAIAHELEWDAKVGSNEIDVQVQRGSVVLLGSVRSWAERLAAQDAAQRVDGVRDISNRIEVELPRDERRSDAELAQLVQSALDWDVFIPKAKISASASGGQVILEGQVEFCSQRDDAERAVRNIRGVRSVLNRISVTPLLGEDHRVQTALEAALERRDARRVNLDVHDGKVILSGVVRSWAERQSVVGAAKGTRGIRSVDDRLLVEPLR